MALATKLVEAALAEVVAGTRAAGGPSGATLRADGNTEGAAAPKADSASASEVYGTADGPVAVASFIANFKGARGAERFGGGLGVMPCSSACPHNSVRCVPAAQRPLAPRPHWRAALKT